jgi:hypothetical protein
LAQSFSVLEMAAGPIIFGEEERVLHDFGTNPLDVALSTPMKKPQIPTKMAQDLLQQPFYRLLVGVSFLTDWRKPLRQM